MSGKKVLLVDDEFHIINVLALKLKGADIEVSTASNGEEGLKEFDTFNPDLVITDYSMPVMDGVNFVKSLRARDEGKDVPIIMLTARGQSVADDNGIDLKLTGLISKPFSPRDVLGKVQAILKE